MRGIVVSGKVKLFAGVLLLQLGYAGLTVVSAITVNMGISKLVFLTYRSAIALAFLAPFAYFLEKNDRPPLSLSLVVQFFGLALLGVTVNQGLFYLGLYYLSPTFASAIWNSTPTMILVMSVALRIESVSFIDKYGWAKVGGTLTTLTGATFIVLFKGPILLHSNSHGFFPLSSPSSNEIKNWSLGCILIIGSCFAWSGWLVLQAPLLKKYPARITLSSFTFFFGVIQLVFISIFMEGDIGMWKIKSKDVILALIYTGVVVSGITFTLQAWCIEKGGPFIVGAFQPVETLTVAIMSSFILGEDLYFGGYVVLVLLEESSLCSVFIWCYGVGMEIKREVKPLKLHKMKILKGVFLDHNHYFCEVFIFSLVCYINYNKLQVFFAKKNYDN